VSKTVKARVETDVLRAAVKPRLGRLMESMGSSFVWRQTGGMPPSGPVSRKRLKPR
jgi:hypothetical protein